MVRTVDSLGYLGIAVLMFLENLLPPIPSELIMPLAGFVAIDGRLALWGAIVAGAVGSLAGTTLWYFVGWQLGEERVRAWAERYGRWVGLSSAGITKANTWLSRHGFWAVVFGRLIPGVRTWISLPVGMARMPLPIFLGLSALGTLVWTALLAWAGYALAENYTEVKRWLGPASNWILGGLLVFWLAWTAWQGLKSARKAD